MTTCTHTLTDSDGGMHFRCPCCGRNSTSDMGKGGRYFCKACVVDFPGEKAPKHVSFRHDVVMSPSVGVCMFCSDPSATFVFDTGEHICERCIQ